MNPKSTLRQFLLAAGSSLLAISSASAADRIWGGGNHLWSNTSATGWNGPVPTATDTATINSGTATFAVSDTYGDSKNTSSAAITINSGGTVASGGRFNSLWNLTLGGGTLLSNGGVNASFGTYNLAGTVTAGASVTSSISSGTGSNNIINLGHGSSSAVTNTTFNVGAGGTLNVGTVLQNHRYWLSGSGTQVSVAGLIKTGDGEMNLNATNTYTGTTAVNAGTLRIGNGGTSGTLGNNSNTSVAAGAVLEINRTDSAGYGYGGALSGSGTVHILSGGRRFDFTTSQTNSGNLSFEVNGTLGIRSATGATAVHLGELSGSGTVQRGGDSGTSATLTIGGKGTSSTFEGNIFSGELGIEKVGSGTLTLTGNNTYGGTTTVSSGILVVDGNHTGSGGGYTVENGAAFGGNGSINRALTLDSDANFWWDGASTLTVADGNAVNLGGMAFGINSLTGFDWADIALGEYILIANNSNFSNISNWGFDERVSVGGGKYAYFSEGSLQLNVVPEPSALGLLGIGLLTMYGLRRHRRR